MELGDEARGGREEEVGGKYEVSRMASQSCSSLPSAGEAFLIKGLYFATCLCVLIKGL